EGVGRPVGVGGVGEYRRGIDRHSRLAPGTIVVGEQLVVVVDDPVVDADDGAVANRVVVGLDRRVALRIVADVDEDLGRAPWDGHVLDQRARAGPLLVHRDRVAGTS